MATLSVSPPLADHYAQHGKSARADELLILPQPGIPSSIPEKPPQMTRSIAGIPLPNPVCQANTTM